MRRQGRRGQAGNGAFEALVFAAKPILPCKELLSETVGVEAVVHPGNITRRERLFEQIGAGDGEAGRPRKSGSTRRDWGLESGYGDKNGDGAGAGDVGEFGAGV